jgi:hypothetical protein
MKVRARCVVHDPIPSPIQEIDRPVEVAAPVPSDVTVPARLALAIGRVLDPVSPRRGRLTDRWLVDGAGGALHGRGKRVLVPKSSRQSAHCPPIIDRLPASVGPP